LGLACASDRRAGSARQKPAKNFYERAKRCIEEATEAERAARGVGAGLSGRLRFCAAVTFARLHVIPHLPRFLARHPDLKVEAILDDRNVDLVGEGIDVALRMGVLADSSMTARKIGQSRRLVLGAPSYFKKWGEPSTPAELAHHPAVIYDQGGGGTTWTFRNGAEEETVTLNELRLCNLAADAGPHDEKQPSRTVVST
jgi:DNA-binding transcriptional LysR family regulator